MIHVAFPPFTAFSFQILCILQPLGLDGSETTQHIFIYLYSCFLQMFLNFNKHNNHALKTIALTFTIYKLCIFA